MHARHYQAQQAASGTADATVATPLSGAARARPGLIAAHGRGKTADDLSRYPLLGDPGGRWTEWFKRFGGTAPKRYVASFDDTETLQRAAVADMGVALARLTLARPLVDAGLLVVLSPQRLKSDYVHYLVYPPRSADHAGLAAMNPK